MKRKKRVTRKRTVRRGVSKKVGTKANGRLKKGFKYLRGGRIVKARSR